MFFKVAVLKNFANFTEANLCWSPLIQTFYIHYRTVEATKEFMKLMMKYIRKNVLISMRKFMLTKNRQKLLLKNDCLVLKTNF